MKSTFKKYLFRFPSGRMTETFAVFVQADIPHDSAEITFVPGAITIDSVSIGANRKPIERIPTFNNGLV